MSVSVQLQDLLGEGDEVLDALAPRVTRVPHLEVLYPIVRLVTVDVVNGLCWQQRTPEMFGHHKAML
jgi:hypothetical protein